jgi:hypothetical protein
METNSRAAPADVADAVLTVGDLMTVEKARGLLASCISGSTATGLNVLGVAYMGLSPLASTALFGNALGSLLAYSLDIVLAKRAFLVDGVPTPLPYTHVGSRLVWLLRSFATNTFFRFIVSVIIETTTGLAMLYALLRALERHKILAHWRPAWRTGVAAALVAVVNFLLFGNILRFDWAYNEAPHPLLNIVVLMWMALAMLVFACWSSLNSPAPEPEPEPEHYLG